MSEKRAKLTRQQVNRAYNEAKTEQLRQQPKIAIKMEVIVYQDGQLEIKNFPNNLTAALVVLSRAQDAVIRYFTDKAKGT